MLKLYTMDVTFSKKINPLRALFGLCSAVHLIFIIIYASEFFLPNGPFPFSLALSFRNPNLLNFIPDSVLGFLPYWTGSGIILWMIFHLALLVSFGLQKWPKIITPLLFVFEYSLLIRTSAMIHGGNLLFLTALIIFIIEDQLPANRKWISNAIWVIQFSLVYLFTGLYKDINLWLLSGDAIQSFINLEALNSGQTPLQLGFFGNLLSYLIVPIEVICPLWILFLYFKNKEVPQKLAFVLCSILALIHLGSFYFFSLFTFPIVGIALIWGIFQGLTLISKKSLKIKILIFMIIFPLHLLPYLGLEFTSISIVPLRNKWTLFSKLPRVKAGQIKVDVKKNGSTIYQNQFNESFHWTRYRFILDESFKESKKTREYLNQYLCLKYKADNVHWETPQQSYRVECSYKLEK